MKPKNSTIFLISTVFSTNSEKNSRNYQKNFWKIFRRTMRGLPVHIKWTKMWSIVTSKVFICTKILFWNFLNFIDILIFSTGLCVNGLLLFCIVPLIYWICKNFCFTQNRLNCPKMANNSNINVQILYDKMLISILSWCIIL